MRECKLNEIRALYRAYKTATDGKEYIKKAFRDAVEDYLTLYVINYAIDGNEINNIDTTYSDYYVYGKRLAKIRSYELTRTKIKKLQGAIIVPF